MVRASRSPILPGIEVPRDATFRQQLIDCGKKKCGKCRRGPGHGPYWYAEWQLGSKTKTKYIGKRLPLDVAERVGTHGQSDEVKKAAIADFNASCAELDAPSKRKRRSR